MTPDFSRIYAELGVQPGCSLEEFQRAYRQRLSERHPDRAQHGESQPDALPLSELIALHSSAIAFHREHGRLPGGTSAVVSPPVWSVRYHPRPAVDDGASHASGARRVLAIALIVGLLAFAILNERQDAPAPAVALRPAPPHAQPELLPSSALHSGSLELGMDTATIRAIQGEPMRIQGDTWEYGPSWLRIEHGELVDWYSSPLYRLKTRTPSPGNPAQSATPHNR